MTSLSKLVFFCALVFAPLFGHTTTTTESDMQQALQLYSDLNGQDENGNQQPFLALMSKVAQANAESKRCTGNWECSWPTPHCENNRCVKSNGDGGQCTGSWECHWPTPHCEKGNCVDSSGRGGECRGNWECKWPYPHCNNGYCEK